MNLLGPCFLCLLVFVVPGLWFWLTATAQDSAKRTSESNPGKVPKNKTNRNLNARSSRSTDPGFFRLRTTAEFCSPPCVPETPALQKTLENTADKTHPKKSRGWNPGRPKLGKHAAAGPLDQSFLHLLQVAQPGLCPAAREFRRWVDGKAGPRTRISLDADPSCGTPGSERNARHLHTAPTRHPSIAAQTNIMQLQHRHARL